MIVLRVLLHELRGRRQVQREHRVEHLVADRDRVEAVDALQVLDHAFTSAGRTRGRGEGEAHAVAPDGADSLELASR